MKKIKLNNFFTFIYIAFCLSLMTACDSTDSTPDEGDAAVTATITIGSGEPFHFVHNIGEDVPGIRLLYSVDYEDKKHYELGANWIEYTPTTNHIALLLDVPGKGTYKGLQDAEDSDYGVFLFTYVANEFDETQKYYNADNVNNVTVTLTEVSETRVKGTFSGVLISEDGKKAVIEDGKFDVIPQYTLIE